MVKIINNYKERSAAGCFAVATLRVLVCLINFVEGLIKNI